MKLDMSFPCALRTDATSLPRTAGPLSQHSARAHTLSHRSSMPYGHVVACDICAYGRRARLYLRLRFSIKPCSPAAARPRNQTHVSGSKCVAIALVPQRRPRPRSSRDTAGQAAALTQREVDEERAVTNRDANFLAPAYAISVPRIK
eukprot:1135196-Rhodomonas_salina.4